MRLLKPLRMSITQRVVTVRREPRLVMGILVMFPFAAPEVALQEVKLWQLVAEEVLADGNVLDECLPKVNGEVLVFGNAYAPKGEARPAFRARLRVGEAIDKAVAVIGRRYWTRTGPTDPEPLTELPLRWEHAFGGEDFERNPAGKGIDEVTVDGEVRVPLPQLEHPKHLVTSRDDRPPPTCFTPLSVELKERIALMGTYGPDYLETDFPGFASDLHPDFFQSAAADQRRPGYFAGGEAIELENLHRERPQLKTHVPRLRARMFVRQLDEEGTEGGTIEVPTRLDTVLLLPNVERGVAVFRGVLPVREEDATDVSLVVAALEGLDAPKPASHYHDAIARRLDPENGYLHMLRDSDFLPAVAPDAPSFTDESYTDMDELLARDGKMMQRARGKAKRELEKMRLSMHVMGIDPDEHLPADVPEPEAPPTMDDLADYVADCQKQGAEMQERLEQERANAEKQMRDVCEGLGLDYEQIVADAQEGSGGPPPFSADQEIRQLRDLAEAGRSADVPMEDLEAKLADPEFIASLRKTEAGLLMAYRMGAHVMGPAPIPDEEAQILARGRVQAALTAGESLVEWNLTGIDLQGLDFSGVDLSRALLERANLTGCRFVGATLEGTVLARAQLYGADFAGANLRGANLGVASAEQANFAGAELREAVLHETRMVGATLTKARGDGGRFFEADLSGADLTGFEAEEMLFFKCKMHGTRLGKAQLYRAMFVYCDMASASFEQARLVRATILECEAPDLDLTEVDATNVAVIKCDLSGVRLSRATLELANLRGINLTGADLSQARAPTADFSEANLTEANLERIYARNAMFVRSDLSRANVREADLMEVLMMQASLDGTRFDGSSLFRANLLGAEGDKARFSGCLVKRVLFSEGAA